MGYLATLFLIIFYILAGRKIRAAFLFSILGNALWLFVAIQRQMPELGLSAIAFGSIATYNWFNWKNE